MKSSDYAADNVWVVIQNHSDYDIRQVARIQNRRRTGQLYERKAAAYLSACGYSILETNFYSHHGELDIIAKDGDTLVFVEVKYRKDTSMGSPWEAVDRRKQQRMYYAAQYYMITHKYGQNTKCRFDVVSILGEDIHVFKNAFTVNI